GVDAALHAHLGGAAGDGVVDLAEDDVEAVGVGVRLPALALERAELAVDEAHVGEVDVAVHDVGDLVPHVGGADGIGGGGQSHQVGAGGGKGRLGAHDRGLVAMEGAGEGRALDGAGGRVRERSTGTSHSRTASISSQGSNQLMTLQPPA